MYHFILNIMLHGVVSVKKIATDENSVYLLTKHVFTIKFKHCLYLIYLCGTWEVLGGEDQRGVQVL
jgi:hypothetical protein